MQKILSKIGFWERIGKFQLPFPLGSYYTFQRTMTEENKRQTKLVSDVSDLIMCLIGRKD